MASKSDIRKTPQKHKVTNWFSYNKALKRRGSLEIWISKDTENIWYAKDRVNDGHGYSKKTHTQTAALGWRMS